jgi:hypothetical protein
MILSFILKKTKKLYSKSHHDFKNFYHAGRRVSGTKDGFHHGRSELPQRVLGSRSRGRSRGGHGDRSQVGTLGGVAGTNSLYITNAM